MAEAELMSGAGIKHVLWTKQPASVNNISRAVALSKRDPTFMFVVDDPQVVGLGRGGRRRAEHPAQNRRLGFRRPDPAGHRERPARGRPGAEGGRVEAHAAFEGFMAYSGNAAHTKTWQARRKKSADDLAGVRETVALARKAGLPVNFVSGGSTGTYNIDKDNGLTELEAGSYVFMDTNYFAIGGKDDDARLHRFRGRSHCPDHRR